MEPLIETAEVEENQHLSQYYALLTLRSPKIAQTMKPGQFLMIRAQNGRDPLLRRPFSAHRLVYSKDDEPVGLTVLVKTVGRGSTLLSCVKPGDALSLVGPLGRGFRIDRPARRFLLVGGGCGIAPIPFTAEHLIRANQRVEIYYGAHDRAELVCLDNLAGLGVPVHIASEDGSMGHRGLITDLITRTLELPAMQTVAILACGPAGMLRAVRDLAARYSAECQISLETAMACGFGVCLGCAVEDAGKKGSYLLTCVDGPVFDAEKVLP